MSLKRYFTNSLLFLALCGTLVSTRAGNITTVNIFALPGFSTGSLSPGLTVSPNNDNASTASPNVITYSIFFNANGNGPADFEFNVANAGGTTEYLIRTGPIFNVINNTGTPWSGFRFELGYGVGANFIRSGALDSLDFDTPERDPAPTSPVFTVLNHQSDLLEWSGGIVSLGQASFSLSIDVPDNLQNFNPAGVNRFTLRQTPQPVPEPATMLLLGTGLAGLGGMIKRRRQGKYK